MAFFSFGSRQDGTPTRIVREVRTSQRQLMADLTAMCRRLVSPALIRTVATVVSEDEDHVRRLDEALRSLKAPPPPEAPPTPYTTVRVQDLVPAIYRSNLSYLALLWAAVERVDDPSVARLLRDLAQAEERHIAALLEVLVRTG